MSQASGSSPYRNYKREWNSQISRYATVTLCNNTAVPPLAFPFHDLLSSDEFTSRRISLDYSLPIKAPFPLRPLTHGRSINISELTLLHQTTSETSTSPKMGTYFSGSKIKDIPQTRFRVLEIWRI